MSTKPKVLLIARARSDASKQKAINFANKISAALSDANIFNCEISQLTFEIGPDVCKIYHPEQNFDLADFDLVIIRHIGAYAIEAQAIALYCQYHNIKFTDSYLNRPLLDNKMSTQFLLWTNGVKNVPYSLYGPLPELENRFAELGEKAVLKDNEGSKGRLNFVVKSAQEIEKIHTDNPDTKFILQKFIPNSSDLRVLVFNHQIKLAIKRSSNSSSHLNNTSQGGKAEIYDVNNLPEADQIACIKAAKITQLEVAGVDLMYNDQTGEPYIIEVNNAPQISSGSFQEEKVNAYSQMITDLLKEV